MGVERGDRKGGSRKIEEEEEEEISTPRKRARSIDSEEEEEAMEYEEEEEEEMEYEEEEEMKYEEKEEMEYEEEEEDDKEVTKEYQGEGLRSDLDNGEPTVVKEVEGRSSPTSPFLDFGDWGLGDIGKGGNLLPVGGEERSEEREEGGGAEEGVDQETWEEETWEEENWEEVPFEPEVEGVKEEPTPLVISVHEVGTPSASLKRKRGPSRVLTREQRHSLIVTHRTTLLSWIAVGLRLTQLTTTTTLLKATILSHLPYHLLSQFPLPINCPRGEFDRKLSELVTWYQHAFRVSPDHPCSILCPSTTEITEPPSLIPDQLLLSCQTLKGCRHLKSLLLLTLGSAVKLPLRLMLSLHAPISLHALTPTLDPTLTPGGSLFWCELWHPLTEDWEPLHPSPTRGRGQDKFSGWVTPSPKLKSLTLEYVLGFTVDGVTDVTSHYVSDYLARHHKLRRRFVRAVNLEVGARKMKRRGVWWDKVLRLLGPGHQGQPTWKAELNRLNRAIREKIPTTLNGFKNHPLLVLERHVLKSQVLLPEAVHLGVFRGEKFYSRAALSELRSVTSWWHRGRVIIPRYLDPTTTLYPEYQTKLYTPAPFQDDKVPKNAFGNFDLFHPTMLPANATHITEPQAASLARKFKYDYAPAVVGFRYHGPRPATPVLHGIVIASRHAPPLLTALRTAQQASHHQTLVTRHTRSLQHWRTYLKFLALKLRLQADYAN